MKKLLLSGLIAFSGISTTQAQSESLSCATDQYHQQMIAKDPTLLKDLQQLIANGMIEKSEEDDTTVFIVPVVFHILHQNGPENIPDANVFDAMEVLNRDFRKQNPDTSLVIPQFDTLVADIRIEFRLASIDPWGNCTNGIDRIYSHETQFGDYYCKLNQWDRSRYLNIWVVRSITMGPYAGYSHYPTSVNGLSYWQDGVVMLYDYVGRLFPSHELKSRTLTHEVGHWLSLPHVWGGASLPGVACGDDGIDDTPVTRGYDYCPAGPLDAIICDVENAVVENYQNYMEYSSCRHMFTKGQSSVMRFVIQGANAQRNNLIQAATHQSTGIDLTVPPVCIPKPDIKASNQFTCVGENVTFTDQSFNGPVTFREWAFQDGTPATSTAPNPVVSFNSSGLKTVTLTVGNASGQVTQVFEHYIDVQEDWAAYAGPTSFDLEPENQYQELSYLNDGDTYSKFEPYPAGYNSNRSLKLTTYKDLSGILPGTEESRYYDNLGGQIDAVITPSFDLRYTSGVTFSFDYSYATNAVESTLMQEEIKVYYSRDCGENWVLLGGPGGGIISGSTLASAGFAGNMDFAPASSGDWATYSQAFNAGMDDDKTRFKIEFLASDYSNNLYIDNIRVSGTLGLAGDFETEHHLLIAPNPVVSGSDLNIQYMAGNEPVTFTLRNLQGEEILSVVRNEVNQPVSFGLEVTDHIAASYYFLEVKSAGAATVKKIAVIK